MGATGVSPVLNGSELARWRS